jgi:hypothetical protein
MCRFESYGGPISAFETNDKESVVLGVSTTGSLIEKKWSRGIARVNYGPTEVGGGLGMGLGALSVVKTSTGRSVFAISAQKRLLYAYWTGAAWSKWKDRADAGDVVAISATSAIDRFVVFGLSDGLDLICWTFPFDGLASVQSLGSTDTGGGLWGTLSAITSPDGSVAIFTISQNRDLLSGTWNRGAWVWQNIGNTVLCGGLSGGVAALREGNAIHIFATSGQNRLLYLRKEDDHWGRWEDLGGPNELGNMRPRLCVTKGWNPIDIFALSQNGRLLHKARSGKDWLDWEVVG